VQEPNVVARRTAEERGLAAPAAAPRDQAGAGAVAKSDRDGRMTTITSLQGNSAAPGAVDARELDEMRRARSGINPTQRVGGRLFILRDSVWTDLGHGESQQVVTVAPYSEAYFALLRALPDLAASFALDPAVLVAGRHASIKIGASGKTRWSTGELERLVREFRS